MEKIVNKNSGKNLEEQFKKIIKEEKVYNFLDENSIPIDKALKHFPEFDLYQNNIDKYSLKYDEGQIILQELKNSTNEGLLYLDEPYFSENKYLEKIDYKTNPTKAKIVKYFLENPKKGLFIIGPNGVGKTTLCVALANHYYETSNKKTLFVFWPDFIEKTKRFKEDNVYFINKVKTSKRLIIDDLGQESISVWSRDDILHPIITYRLEKNLPTYITTNYLKEELQNIYTFRQVESKKTKSILEKVSTLTKSFNMGGENLRNIKQEDNESR